MVRSMREMRQHEKKCVVKHESKNEAEHEDKNEAAN
jgi:hypothetical protein